MAFASSRIGAQEALIKPCDLCDDDEDVNWFCKDCVKNLCERCKRGHLKIAICKNHNLVSILEGISITKGNVSNMCPDHDIPFSFFCRTCDNIVCSKCIAKIHSKHDFVDIHEFQSELQSKVDYILKEKEEEEEQIKKNIEVFAEYESECGNLLEQNCAVVDRRVKDIQLAVAEEGEELKRILKTSSDEHVKKALEGRQKLEAKKHVYHEEIQTVKQSLPLQTAPTFNQFFNTSISTLQSLRPLSLSIPKSNKFTVGDIHIEHIKDMIGKVEIERVHETVPKSTRNTENKGKFTLSKSRIVSMYELKVQTSCYSLSTSPDGNIWLGGRGCVYKMSSDCSTIIHRIPALESYFFCNHMDCLQSGDSVMSYDGGQSKIDRFTSDGRRLKFTNLSPKYTRKICVTCHDKVVVNAAYHPLLFSPSFFLLVFSKEGNLLQEIKRDKEIASFCIDDRGNIIISEKGFSNSLTVINMEGSVLKNIKVNCIKNAKANVRRMTCDRHGNILILIQDEKQVYLISGDGKVEQVFTVLQCARKINDICIDCENRLLILVDYAKVIIINYLE